MEKFVYLDNAATTQPDYQVLDEITKVNQEYYGNPSSIYTIGQESKNIIQQAQRRIAMSINCNADEIIFTSGGTESNNLAILGTCSAIVSDQDIITSSIEHPSVLNTCKYLESNNLNVIYLPVDENGIIDLKILEKNINKNTRLISIMFVNNEIGSVQPIKEIGKIARKYGIKFHCDAIQAFGHYPIDVDELNIDLLSVSGHKINAPKGVGFLYVRNKEIDNILYGGHQQEEIRPGTENIGYIHGIGVAISKISKNIRERENYLYELKLYLINKLLEIENIFINAKTESNAIINFRINNVNSEKLIIRLGLRNIYISGGSACNSSQPSASHVLKALGLTDAQSKESVRISLSMNNTKEDIDIFINELKKIIITEGSQI